MATPSLQWDASAVALKVTTASGGVITMNFPDRADSTAFNLPDALDGKMFVATADAVVANTATASTLIGTGVGTKTLAANTDAVGSTYRVTARGKISCTASTPTIQFKLKIGTTTILDSGALTLASALTNASITLNFDAVFRAVGASGQICASDDITIKPAYGAPICANVIPAITSFDNTTSKDFELTATWGTASASNTITINNLLIERF